MAEVKTIKIDVDTKQATQAMENLSKATHDVSASFEEVYGDLQPLTTRMGEAEDRLYELANAGQTATKEYQDLLTTVGNYRKVQIQTDMAVDAAATTMSQKLGGALGGATAGFQLVQGAMGAFGTESAQVEEALLKVQSAMDIAEGVQGFKDAIPSIKAFGMALKGAIGASGIGLLVIALGTVAAYWDDIKAAVSGVSDEQEKLNAKAQANVNIQENKFNLISGQENILKLQGKSEKEITELKLRQIQMVIKATEAQLVQQENTKKAEVAAVKRNEGYLKMVLRAGLEMSALVLRYLSAPIDLAIMAANKVSEVLGYGKLTAFNINAEITKMTSGAAESITKYFFDSKATEDEANKTINETKAKLGELKNQAAGFQLSLKDMNKPAETVVKDSGKNIQEEAKRIAIEKENEFQQKLEDIAEQNYLNTLSDQEKELRAVQDKYFELETLAQGNADALQQIEIAKMNELNDINLKYQQQAYDLDKAAKEKKKELDKKAAEDEIAQAKAVEEQKKAIQMQGLEAASQGVALIKGVFEKSKSVQKAAVIAESAIGIAKMIIANKAANVAALATPQAIATSGAAAVPVIAMNNISTGIGIAGNIAATAKALQSLGGGSVPAAPPLEGGGGSAGGGMQAPQFNVVGNSGINQLAQLQQTPMQAYVVSGEVTSAQALDRNRVQNATL